MRDFSVYFWSTHEKQQTALVRSHIARKTIREIGEIVISAKSHTLFPADN